MESVIYRNPLLLMRLTGLLCLVLLAMPEAHAQPTKSTPSATACEVLCAELFASIRANPGKMVMRLEEALVINERCAAEIVTAAIDAVNADPAMVRKIVDTATEIAPRRSALITAAVKHYSAPVAVVAAAEVKPLEIRRAELPDTAPTRPEAGEEVRRAELPSTPHNTPIIEVRRAVIATPTAEPTVTKQLEPTLNLMSVPKAKPLK